MRRYSLMTRQPLPKPIYTSTVETAAKAAPGVTPVAKVVNIQVEAVTDSVAVRRTLTKAQAASIARAGERT